MPPAAGASPMSPRVQACHIRWFWCIMMGERLADDEVMPAKNRGLGQRRTVAFAMGMSPMRANGGRVSEKMPPERGGLPTVGRPFVGCTDLSADGWIMRAGSADMTRRVTFLSLLVQTVTHMEQTQECSIFTLFVACASAALTKRWNRRQLTRHRFHIFMEKERRGGAGTRCQTGAWRS